MNRTQYAKKNIAWGFINKGTNVIIPFVIRTVFLYFLGKQYLGLDSVFTSVLQMLNIAEMGFSSAVTFSLYKPVANNDREAICNLLSYYKNVYRIIGGVVLVIGIAIMPFLPVIIKDTIPDELNLYLLYLVYLINIVLGYWMFAYKKVLLTAFQRNDIISAINTALSLIRLLIQIIILIVWKNYYCYLIIMPVFTIFDNICVYMVTNKMHPDLVAKGCLPDEQRKDIGKRIQGLFIQKICATSRNSMDNIIISGFINLTAVAMYGNYYTIIAGIHSLLACITGAISASVGNSIAVDSPEKNHKDMLKFNFMYMWCASICTICLFCVYQEFIRLWAGRDNLLGMPFVILFCMYFYSLCIGDIRALYTTGAGLWWEGRYRSLAEALTNIFLNIILGKLFGMIGVICATLISIVLINHIYGTTIVYRFYFKNGKLLKFYTEHLQYSIVTCISCSIIYFICSMLPLEGIANIILRLAVCFIGGNLLLLLFYCRKEQFKASIKFVKNRFLFIKKNN